jgi:hypothetical protein
MSNWEQRVEVLGSSLTPVWLLDDTGSSRGGYIVWPDLSPDSRS